MIASGMYKDMMGKGYLFHVFQRHVRIECDFSQVLEGADLKRHQKAYSDLIHLLEQCPSMVETYFTEELTSVSFEALCHELYTGGRFEKPQSQPRIQQDPHIHPPHNHAYSLNCIFSEAQIAELHSCIEGHQIFEPVTKDEVRAFFSGTLDHPVQCRNSVRLGYLLRGLAIKGLITNQYQLAVARCGYILSPRNSVPMTQKHMQDAVSNAGGYATTDDKIWKRTINQSIDTVLLLSHRESE